MKFEQAEVQAPYKCGQVKETRKYTVRFRPALDAVKHALEDPALRKHLIRYPERRYVRKPGTNENMRVWTDVHTADDWWQLQVILPLASFAHAEHWPLEQNGPPPDTRCTKEFSEVENYIENVMKTTNPIRKFYTLKSVKKVKIFQK